MSASTDKRPLAKEISNSICPQCAVVGEGGWRSRMDDTARCSIPDEFFTAYPLANASSKLSRLYREGIQLWGLKHVDMLEAHSNVDVCQLRELIAGLDVSRKWSPQLFFAIYHLTDACERIHLTDCYDAIVALENLTDEQIYDATARVDSILSEPWEYPFVRRMRQYDAVETLVYPMLRHELEPHQKAIKAAQRLIEEVDPEVWEEYQSYVSRIKIYKGKGLRGETSTMVFGSMWMRIPPPDEVAVAYWVSHIVHETSHLQLMALGIHDKLVLNDDTPRFLAPIRRDLRPMFGIFHAAFVLSRMVRIFRRLAAAHTDPVWGENLEIMKEQFDKALSVVFSEEAILTPAGRRIRDSLPKVALES